MYCNTRKAGGGLCAGFLLAIFMKKSLAYRDSECRLVYMVSEVHENKKNDIGVCGSSYSSCEVWTQVLRPPLPLHPRRSLFPMPSRSQIFPNPLKQILFQSFRSRG